MPLVDCHDTYSGIGKILGKIDDVRVEGDAVVGRASLARKHADLLPDIIDGYFGQISAGYDYDLRRDTEIVEREGGVPLLLVKRWLLTEGSLVPVGADPNSFIRSLHGSAPYAPSVRSAETPKTQEKKMDIEALVKAAEEAVASAEEAIGAAEDAIPEDLVERIRTLRGARAEEDTSAAADEKADGERAEREDKPTADDAEVEAVRSIAKGYGLEKVVTDMRALGARAADIKSAVAKTIAERGAQTVDAAVTVKPAARSAVAAFDPSAVFAARNKR
ncbi:hypothetical protein ACCT18_01340 [Rhizobium ruizarguesonis]